MSVVLVPSPRPIPFLRRSRSGKDHWPSGSFIVMEKNHSRTNRVIRETDDLHFAPKINSQTLQRDDSGGTLIFPTHVHKALRRYLGIENTSERPRFPFHDTEELPLFARLAGIAATIGDVGPASNPSPDFSGCGPGDLGTAVRCFGENAVAKHSPGTREALSRPPRNTCGPARALSAKGL